MPWTAGMPAWLRNQWGVISGQAAQRATTREIFQALAPYAAAAPGGWTQKGVFWVTMMRSAAVKIRTAADAITKTGFSGTITAEHIAEAPWSREPVNQRLSPRFLIRSQVTSGNPEAVAGLPGVPDTVTQWVTHFTSRLPATLEQLVEDIKAQAGSSGSPPLPVLGITRIEILRE